MKRYSAVFLVTLLFELAMRAQQTVAVSPFGFSSTMTKADVLRLVGTPSKIEEGGFLVFETAPHPNSLFKSYRVLVPMGYHVLEVAASTGPLDTNRFGTELMERYDRIKTALISKYGLPRADANSLESGSLWTEPEDFMMGLLEKDRYLGAVWDLPSDTHIILIADALYDDVAQINVIYCLPGCEEYEARHQAAEDGSSF